MKYVLKCNNILYCEILSLDKFSDINLQVSASKIWDFNLRFDDMGGQNCII